MRLQRFLASAGVASRRKAEELIVAGRVKVNGKVVRTLGTKVDPSRDRIYFEGERVIAEDHVWLLLNKPGKCVSTASDPEGRETVLDIVGPQGVRLYPVGRLDYATEGVLLLTNDGDLAHALMHPKNQIPRVYHVKVKGIIDPDRLDPLRKGVTLDTGERVMAQVGILGTTEKHTWLEMTLKEGRNRQIHRMLECVELMVLKLIRISYAELTVEGLAPGRYRALTQAEVNKLRAMVKLQGETRKKAARPPGRRSRRGRKKR
jgi:23S rRNA pseudouridine2605 synthase